ncbi:MAG: methyl-accepting chemotaxis protein, partial [Pseudomonadota bacterium]
MKGMLDFLEKAGLVKKDAPAELPPADDLVFEMPVSAAPPPAAQTASAPDTSGASATADQVEGAPLKLDEIYAREGVAASLYPAERLLRLLDGLSAMDENTRNMAIRAMDAADESWSIEDPLADAHAKLAALASHAQQLQSSLQQLEAQTQNRLDALRAAQDKRVGDIRKQISELEALAARETARGTQECEQQEALLNTARNTAARDLREIAQLSQRL